MVLWQFQIIYIFDFVVRSFYANGIVELNCTQPWNFIPYIISLHYAIDLLQIHDFIFYLWYHWKRHNIRVSTIALSTDICLIWGFFALWLEQFALYQNFFLPKLLIKNALLSYMSASGRLNSEFLPFCCDNIPKFIQCS